MDPIIYNKSGTQSGQTLIETMVAVVILIMGISSTVGLAIYAYGGTSNVAKQIVAVGLAREGLEAVKNMRDTNWLQDTLAVNGCYDFATSQANKASCYQKWIGDTQGNGGGVPYCLDPTHSAWCHGDDVFDSFKLGLDSTLLNSWVFNWTGTPSDSYGLKFNNPSNSAVWQTNGFYSTSNAGCVDGPGLSDYCREIVLNKVSTAPFNQDVGPLLQVKSRVWWVDKKCTRVANYDSANPACRVELDTYLTNWKNFQP